MKNKQKNSGKGKSVRNEYHFYLQLVSQNQCYIQKNKKKEIPRKQKHKKADIINR